MEKPSWVGIHSGPILVNVIIFGAFWISESLVALTMLTIGMLATSVLWSWRGQSFFLYFGRGVLGIIVSTSVIVVINAKFGIGHDTLNVVPTIIVLGWWGLLILREFMCSVFEGVIDESATVELDLEVLAINELRFPDENRIHACASINGKKQLDGV